LALCSLIIAIFLGLIAVFAPFLANDRPILLYHEGVLSMPIFNRSIDWESIQMQCQASHNCDEQIAIMPFISYHPNTFDLNAILALPSQSHLLGTTRDGRDVAANLIWGARISMSVGFVSIGIASFIGIILGMLAGYYGGWVDLSISRFIEIMICFPTFFLIITILAFVGPSIYNIMIVIGLTGWTGIARLVRGEVLKVKCREFILASIVSGARDTRIMWRHILPHAISPLWVPMSFGIASAILAESGLSFLGFGVSPSTPSWGNMLSQAMETMDIAWWLTLAPGSAIFITVIAYNLIGEHLRDVIDPNIKE